MEPWIKIYTPKSTNEIIGQNGALQRLKAFVDGYKRQKKKALLLCGPTGSGKTSSVHAIARDLGLEIIEINASDTRNKESIQFLLGSALGQQSLFNRGKIVLVDEVDGISGTKDRGGLPAIISLIEKSSFPIIFTANDIWNQKFSGLRKKCEVVEYQKLEYKDIATQLKSIAQKENIQFEEAAIIQLARESDGDLRAAINDLQVLGSDKKITKKEIEEHFQRTTKDTVNDALFKIFKTKNLKIALPAFENVDENIDRLFLWIEENIPKEYKKIPDIARAFEALSIADKFFGRIRRWQYYRFYVYIYDLLSAGIALAKDEKYAEIAKYGETTRVLKIWMANMKNLKKKAIAEKIALKTHCSTKRALEDVYYLKYIFQKSKKGAENIEFYLDLNSEEAAWLRK